MSVYDEDMGIGPERWRGENPGDTLEEVVSKVTRLQGTKFDSTKVGLAYLFETANGPVEWTAWNMHAKRQLAEIRPEVGDRVRVTFDGLDGSASNLAPTRLYTIKVIARANGGPGDIPAEF